MSRRPSVTGLEILDLLGLYSDILNELCDRGVLRTVNNPAADYAEYLVARALSLSPASASTKKYDALDDSGLKYEVKARRLTRGSRPTRFSAIRGLDERPFDYLVAVLFNEDFVVHQACVFPIDYVAEKAFWQAYVNGWILPISDDLWLSTRGRDITETLRKVQTPSAV